MLKKELSGHNTGNKQNKLTPKRTITRTGITAISPEHLQAQNLQFFSKLMQKEERSPIYKIMGKSTLIGKKNRAFRI